MKLNINKMSSLFVIIITLITLSSCDSSTKPKYGSLQGRVILINDSGNTELNPIDFAGIKVSLYHIAEYDTSIVNALNKHPNLGFQLSQNSEFEHGLSNSIMSVISSPDGSFKFGKIPYGKYNLVFEKSGWGYRYIYDVQINSKETNLNTSQEELQLYPEQRISGTIDHELEASNWHHIVIEDNTMFLPTSSLTLGPNGFLRFSPGVQVDVFGTVKLSGTNENMFQVVLKKRDNKDSSLHPYSHFNLLSSAILSGDIRDGRFSGGARLLGLHGTNNVNISKCRFLVYSDGIYANQVSGLSIEKSVFSASVTTKGNGTGIYSSERCSIQHNLFYKMLKGFEVMASNGVQLQNNSFIKIDSGVESYDTSTQIKHNYFHNNNLAMLLAGESSPQALYNQIESSNGIIVGKNWYYMNCTPTINNNNLQCMAISLTLTQANEVDINAINNFYYTTDTATIRSKIKHKPDYPADQQQYIGYIIYEPFRTTKVTNAGILN